MLSWQPSDRHLSFGIFAGHDRRLFRADQVHRTILELVDDVIEGTGHGSAIIKKADIPRLAEVQDHLAHNDQLGKFCIIEALAIQRQAIEAVQPVIVVRRAPLREGNAGNIQYLGGNGAHG